MLEIGVRIRHAHAVAARLLHERHDMHVVARAVRRVRPDDASAATYCTWPEASSANALLRSSVVEKVALSNSFVTAQALFDDTCAAIFVSTTFVGTACWTARRTTPRP